MRLVRFIRSGVAAASLVVALSCLFAASDPKPVVGPGATKDEVINAYGWPNGQSQSGTKEILSYAQGDVFLENGRVERVNFSPNVPWQAPRPRPGPPTASTRKIPEAPTDYWVTTFGAARDEALRRHSRILALFTGSDWSPASQEFHEEVEFQPEFINAFAGDFVFLKLDYPRGGPVPAKISDENLALRDKYSVTTYPTILVLSANGDLLGRADLDKTAPGVSFRDRVIAAVRDVRDATRGPDASVVKPANALIQAKPTVTSGTSASAQPSPAQPRSRIAGLRSAGLLVALGLIGGGVLVVVVLWRMWRRPKTIAPVQVTEMAGRIDAAAAGLPLPSEITAWPHAKLRLVVAKLAEFDNYASHVRPAGEDVDIELRKRGDVNPRVLVCCLPGSAGVGSAKRVRELFASLAAEGAESGWVVAPAGFANDAREYAKAHKILLIGVDGLQNMMREVPAVSLPRVLAAT